MKTKSAVLFLILLVSFAHTIPKHECINHQLNDTQIYIPNPHQGKRMLSEERESFRITYDIQLDSDRTQEIMEKFNKFETIIKLALDFFSKSLKVNRLLDNNKFHLNEDKCGFAKVPNHYKTHGVPNSDLHIFFGFFSNTNSSTLAYANLCASSASDYDFENYFETALHEITHILGFLDHRIPYFIDPATGKSYNQGSQANKIPIETEVINGKVTKWLTTPIVREMARKHFGCPTLKGLQLENDYGGGSRNHHWERSTFENEYMNAFHSGHDAMITKFTFALLEDSGWYYPTYEYLDEVSWGKDQGCQFLYSCDQDKHREFDNSPKFCSYYHNFIGYHVIGKDGETRQSQICHDFQSVSAECSDVRRNDEDWNGNTFKETSKCFESNIFDKDHGTSYTNFRCLEYKCTEKGGIDVYVKGQRYPIDRTTNRVWVVPRGKNDKLEGFVDGPLDWDAFCNSYPKACPKYCSSNGYCVGSQCHCGENYAGLACDIYCPQGNYAYNGRCLQSKQCPIGSSLQKTSKECVVNKIVPQCSNSEVLLEGICVQECPVGYYNKSGMCENCIFNCEQCNDYYSCEKCKEAKFLQSDKSKCRDCVEGCQRCTGDQCYECEEGFVNVKDYHPITGDWIMTCQKTCPRGHAFVSNQDCYPCHRNCEECQDSNVCQYVRKALTQQVDFCEKIYCTTILGCETCFDDPQQCEECQSEFKLQENDNNKICVYREKQKCRQRQYSYRNMCFNCPRYCLNCIDAETCTNCHYLYTLVDNKCLKPDYCQLDNCKQCADKYNCAVCNKGYNKEVQNNVSVCVQGLQCKYWQYVKNNQCEDCPDECNECTDYQNCTECADPDYHLVNGKCILSSCEVQNCDTCRSRNSCQECQEGYYSMSTNQNTICCTRQQYVENNQCQNCSEKMLQML